MHKMRDTNKEPEAWQIKHLEECGFHLPTPIQIVKFSPILSDTTEESELLRTIDIDGDPWLVDVSFLPAQIKYVAYPDDIILWDWTKD